jgi:hypothetical protein
VATAVTQCQQFTAEKERGLSERVGMFAYIAAGELAGEPVAGLVEEDGDELERREQERPPQLQRTRGDGESKTSAIRSTGNREK